MGVGTVSEYLERARRAGLGWPLPGGAGRRRRSRRGCSRRRRPAGNGSLPDLAAIHQELKGVGVTLHLLWEEYREVHGESGYGYSQFCELYRRWAGRLEPVDAPDAPGGREDLRRLLRQAAATSSIGKTGEMRSRSSCSWRCSGRAATPTPRRRATPEAARLDRRARADARVLRGLGGDLGARTSSRARSRSSCRYEPASTARYQELASHYGAVVIPARPRQAAGQGEGRVDGAGGPALDPGPAAQPHLLRPRPSSTRRSASCSSELNAGRCRSSEVSRRELWEQARPAGAQAAARRALRAGAVDARAG